MNIEQLLSKARTGLVLDHPFFASLLLSMPMREDPSCPTMWTDGRSLGYNPGWIEQLSLGKLKGSLCHEIMHCVSLHPLREGNRDHSKWNMATDYAINPTVLSAGLELPDGHLYSPRYTGKSAEEIYSLLPGPPQKEHRNDPGGCGETRTPTKASSPEGPSANHKSRSLSQAEISRLEQEWKVKVAQAAQQAKAMGNLPASLERWVEKIIHSKMDWRSLLWKFLQSIGRDDYRWIPPSRRYIHLGLYFPSVRSEEMEPLVLAIDTSGSISQGELDLFAGELNAVLEQLRPDVQVIYCDCRVQKVEQISQWDYPVTIHPSGGGGTSFRPPFEWIEKQSLTPSCLIYLTDGWCNDFPKQAPGYLTLWAVIDNEEFKAPFGEVINLGSEQI